MHKCIFILLPFVISCNNTINTVQYANKLDLPIENNYEDNYFQFKHLIEQNGFRVLNKTSSPIPIQDITIKPEFINDKDKVFWLERNRLSGGWFEDVVEMKFSYITVKSDFKEDNIFFSIKNSCQNVECVIQNKSIPK